MTEKEEKKTEATRKAQREYRRKWLKRNPEKTKEYMARYWTKKASELFKGSE